MDWDTTKTDGSYELYVPAGTYEMWAGSDAYQEAALSGVVFNGGTAVRRDFALRLLPPVDTTDPVTISDAKPIYTSSATINLTATDAGGSGVAATYYRLDGGVQQSGRTVTTSSIGHHYIMFWSVDEAGNTESVKYAYFEVRAPGDTTPPVTTVDAVTPSKDSPNTQVRLRIVDDVSGVASTYFVIDGGSLRHIDAPASTITVDIPGVHTLQYWSVDKAGNKEALKTMTVTVMSPESWMSGTWCYTSRPSKIKRNKTHAFGFHLQSLRSPDTSNRARIYKYRKVKGKWKPEGYVTAKYKKNEGAYRANIKFSKKGGWRLRTYMPADGMHRATWSTYTYLKVK